MNKPQKKILYVITKANWGGAQRYVYDLAVAAKEAGHEVAVAYGSPGELAARLQAAHIPTFAIAGLGRDIRLFKDSAAFFSLLRIIRSFRPDVLHLNSSKIGGIGALAGRLVGVRKILFTAHAWAFNEERPWYQKISIAFLAWLTTVLSTHTIVVSTSMKEQIIRGPFVRRKVSVIPNGTRSYALLDKTEARRALAALHPALSVSDLAHDVWIGTVAELHPVKGLPYAIEAIELLRKKYPAIRYVILGEGQMRETLEKQITERDLRQNVFLLGRVEEAPLYGKAYDLFLLPSISEAFGIAILEAGLAALPVVATHVGGIPEIITSGETGTLIPAKDPAAVARALDALLADASLRHKLGVALKERVERDFSIERLARETFAQY
jgi:glycosyltransferase involved in cell wall biosynthesis